MVEVKVKCTAMKANTATTYPITLQRQSRGEIIMTGDMQRHTIPNHHHQSPHLNTTAMTKPAVITTQSRLRRSLFTVMVRNIPMKADYDPPMNQPS